MKLNRLIELEKEYPEYFDENSPSQRVGGSITKSFDTVVHESPMYSLNNSYSKEDLEDWQSRVIKKLTNKLQITNYNHQQNVVVNNHIQLLNYQDTDLSHLTSMDYMGAINKVNYATFEIIKKIHFNPSKPENMNIYIPNIKDKYVVMFQENAWQIQARNKEVDNLMEDKYMMLKEWYDENVRDEAGYDQLKRNFQRFDANIENDQVRDRVKNEIIMFLYNKRNMFVKGNEELEASSI